jgi:antitoxin MazE
MIVKFAKWGNSLGVRIPATFASELGVSENSTAELSVQGRRLVLEPVAEAPVFDLDELVAKITDENRHDEAPTGAARGNEFG